MIILSFFTGLDSTSLLKILLKTKIKLTLTKSQITSITTVCAVSCIGLQLVYTCMYSTQLGNSHAKGMYNQSL